MCPGFYEEVYYVLIIRRGCEGEIGSTGDLCSDEPLLRRVVREVPGYEKNKLIAVRRDSMLHQFAVRR